MKMRCFKRFRAFAAAWPIVTILAGLLSPETFASGNWLKCGFSAPDSVGFMLLLSDGTDEFRFVWRWNWAQRRPIRLPLRWLIENAATNLTRILHEQSFRLRRCCLAYSS